MSRRNRDSACATRAALADRRLPERRLPDPQSGAGTVLALAIIACLMLLALGLSALVAAQHGRTRAQTAADLGALAGASALRLGFDPCAIAAATVEHNKAQLRACERRAGGIVVVETAFAVQSLPDWAPGTAIAAARAGPRN